MSGHQDSRCEPLRLPASAGSLQRILRVGGLAESHGHESRSESYPVVRRQAPDLRLGPAAGPTARFEVRRRIMPENHGGDSEPDRSCSSSLPDSEMRPGELSARPGPRQDSLRLPALELEAGESGAARRHSVPPSGGWPGPSGTLPTFDIEVRTFDILISRYCNWNLRYRRSANDLRYRDTIFIECLAFDIECSKSDKHRYRRL
jgi:hypothetical protein